MDSHKEECSTNHERSSDKMEVDGIVEIFKRPENLHGVKYLSYIGYGDNKTYTYDDNISVIKEECCGHVQKCMGARLRKLKKDTKGLGGKGKLTTKLIDELTVYYGLAIKRNKNSKENMKKAIWATTKHKCSTVDNLEHEDCPPGLHSWCTYLVAKTCNQLDEYTHKPVLHPDVIKA